jgi:hypothetical protein
MEAFRGYSKRRRLIRAGRPFTCPDIGRGNGTGNSGLITINMVNTIIIKTKTKPVRTRPSSMNPKLIRGKVWIYVESTFGGGYQELPAIDPKYQEIFLRIDSQRFVDLLDWVYNRQGSKKASA